MSILKTLYLYHHGELTSPPTIKYVGGKKEVIPNFDTDMLLFRDLEEFVEKYGYESDSIVYFLRDGKSLKSGVRVLYDDNTVREMIDLHKHYGEMSLFVEHFDYENMLDLSENPDPNQDNLKETEDKSNLEGDVDLEDVGSGEDDSEYEAETEPESEEDGSLYDESECDEELKDNRIKKKKFKQVLNNPVQGPNLNSEESDFNSYVLISEDSSSEDENHRIGYVGPSNPKKRKRRVKSKHDISDGGFRWEVGMKFVNMQEFRDLVRQYGLTHRRGVQFVTDDRLRCQVCCEADCPFYIWCSKDKNLEVCTIKTLDPLHLCTKPYSNKLASVKKLCEIYGERVRKNPQWRIKEMAETIKKELEIDVSRIKILRVRKMALDGVHDALKEQYSRLWDFGHELLKSYPRNTVKISRTRLNETDACKFRRIYVCYYALKAGWKAGCMPVIGLDGCFLKTVCGGQLLSAVGRDGNNQMFPIAYVIVESENMDSLWSKAYFSTHCLADNVDNNMSECFNAWIINERYQPVLTMLQELHFKLMSRLRQKRDEMVNGEVDICPVIKRKLDKLVTESRGWTSAWDGEKKYQVKQGTRSVIVDLELPLVPDNSDIGSDFCLTGTQSRHLENSLRGPLGHMAVFQPHPAQRPFKLGGSTVSSTTEVQNVPSQSSMSSTATRRSVRLATKGQMKFNNTEDDPITLGDN